MIMNDIPKILVYVAITDFTYGRNKDDEYGSYIFSG
jgi:hypothetical protein